MRFALFASFIAFGVIIAIVMAEADNIPTCFVELDPK